MTLAQFKHILLSITLCSIGLISPMPGSMQRGTAGAPGMGMPDMSQDPQAMMQELEKAAQEIDSFVKSLPEKEQQEFYQMVEKIENKIQHKVETEGEEGLANLLSNPQEFERFMEEVSRDVMPMQPGPETVPQEVKPAQKKAPVKTTVQKSKEDEAIELLNTITKETNAFLVKAQAMPELASKVARWGKTKRIYDWQPGLNWQDVKTEIEKLGNKISLLTERDPKNNQYKYLSDLLKEESLYNNLAKLKTSLVEYVPKIEVSTFGIEKMNKSSKTALQRTISSYTEALYRLKLPDGIDAIVAKYEPRAQELRTLEEEAKKRAEQEAKRPRVPGRVEVGGQAENGFGGGYYPSQDYDYYGGGYSGGYTPDYGYNGGYQPSYAAESYRPSEGQAATTGETPLARKAAATKEKEAAEKTKAEKPAVKKDDKKKEKAIKPKLDKTDIMVQEMIKNVDTSLEQAAKAIQAENNLLNIDDYLKTAVAPDAMQQDAQALMQFYTDQFGENDNLVKLAEAGNELEKLQSKAKPFTALKKKGIQEQLKRILNKNVRTKKGMNITIKETLDQFVQKIDNLEKGINDGSIQVPAYKKYLFIDTAVENPENTEEREALEMVKQTMSRPEILSLYSIRDAIKKLEKIITDFAQQPKRIQGSSRA